MKNVEANEQEQSGAAGGAAIVDPGPSASLAAARLRDASALVEPSLDDMAEAVIAWSQAAFGTAEIVAAQEQFFAEKGKVFPDDAFYDTRMSYFFDWFLLERPLASQATQSGQCTPYALFCDRLVATDVTLSDAAKGKLAALGSFRHSLFQIAKIQETSMVVTDLARPGRHGKLVVRSKGAETYRGLEKKNIFQGFLFQVGDVNHLSNGIVLHPQRVSSFLKKQLKIAQKSGQFDLGALLSRFASLQTRHLRHRHVDPKVIYQATPKG